MEPDARYYRRRATEELAAADRSVTLAARKRRLQLAGLYLNRLRELDEPSSVGERELHRRMACQVASPHWVAPREAQVA